MGGISVILLFTLLWPLMIAVWLLSLLDVALPAIATGLLLWNGAVLVFLLWLRGRDRIRSALDRANIDAQTGGKRALLLVLRYGWVVLTVWVGLMVLACAAYLIWRPSLLGLFM